jgi:hypothetical protein
MKTFRQHLQENYANAFEKAKLVANYLDGRSKERYLTAINSFADGYKAKAVYNAAFTDNYSYGFSRGLESAYDKMHEKYRNDIKGITSREDEMDLWGINPQSIAKVNRICAKYPDLPKELLAFVDSVKDMPGAIKELKTYIIKGKPPKPVDPNTFVKPMAPYESKKLAMKFLQEAVDSFKKEYEQSVRKYTMESYNRIKDLTDPADFKKMAVPDQGLAGVVFMRDGYRIDSPFKLKPEPEKIIERLIQDTVTEVIDHFVGKNTDKLALIFAKKAEIKEHKILKTRIRNGMLENDMSFAFTDGSSFVITSQVIYKYTQAGKPFVQYPTRFTNVIMADGSRMTGVSEEKMISIF